MISSGWNYPEVNGHCEAIKSSWRRDDGRGWIVEFDQDERRGTTEGQTDITADASRAMPDKVDFSEKKKDVPQYTVYTYAVRNSN